MCIAEFLERLSESVRICVSIMYERDNVRVSARRRNTKLGKENVALQDVTCDVSKRWGWYVPLTRFMNLLLLWTPFTSTVPDDRSLQFLPDSISRRVVFPQPFREIHEGGF